MPMKPAHAVAVLVCVLSLPAWAMSDDSFEARRTSDPSELRWARPAASAARPPSGGQAVVVAITSAAAAPGGSRAAVADATTTAVPEPPTYALLVAGAVAAGLICWRRLRRKGDDSR